MKKTKKVVSIALMVTFGWLCVQNLTLAGNDELVVPTISNSSESECDDIDWSDLPESEHEFCEFMERYESVGWTKSECIALFEFGRLGKEASEAKNDLLRLIKIFLAFCILFKEKGELIEELQSGMKKDMSEKIELYKAKGDMEVVLMADTLHKLCIAMQKREKEIKNKILRNFFAKLKKSVSPYEWRVMSTDDEATKYLEILMDFC